MTWTRCRVQVPTLPYLGTLVHLCSTSPISTAGHASARLLLKAFEIWLYHFELALKTAMLSTWLMFEIAFYLFEYAIYLCEFAHHVFEFGLSIFEFGVNLFELGIQLFEIDLYRFEFASKKV